jgi:adenylate cyclase class 2
VLRRLSEIGADRCGEEFEENTLYRGGSLDPGRKALRLRRIGETTTLTYKERRPGRSAIKYQREEETAIADPEATNSILELLGFRAALVYEKRRQTWRIGDAALTLDELPFGLYMEIEGSVRDIRKLEQELGLKDLPAEPATYPQLTVKHGTRRGKLVESRFKRKRTK